MLVIVAILLTVLLSIAALAIDLGSLDQAQQQAQAAADAGALAAADDLASSASSVTTDATNYATTNDPGAAVAVTPSASQVSVKVTKSIATPLAGIFGNGSSKVSATATAAAGTSGGTQTNATIFAMDANDSNCSNTGVTLTGNTGLTVTGTSGTGAIDTNGRLDVESNTNSSFGAVSYGKKCGAPTQSGNTGVTYASGPTRRTTTTTTWPVDYTSATSACSSWYSGDFDVYYGSNLTYNGILCVSGNVDIENINGLTGKLTLIATGTITMKNDSNINVTPYYQNDLLFYQEGSGTCSLQGVGFSGGTIFVPSGTLSISGAQNWTVNGMLEANQIVLNNDSQSTFTGNGPVTGSGSGGGGTAALQQ